MECDRLQEATIETYQDNLRSAYVPSERELALHDNFIVAALKRQLELVRDTGCVDIGDIS